MNRRLWPGIIGVLAATLAGAAAAQAAVPITTCGYTIITPGSYVLAADLNQCPADGIDITVSNVNLTLNGHIITGVPPNNSPHGISVQGSGRISNINISGMGLIEQFGQGVALTNVDNAQIDGIVSVFNTRGAVSSGCTNVQFSQDVFSKNVFNGLDLEGDNADEIQHSEISGNDTISPGSLLPQMVINGGGRNQVHDNNISVGGYIGLRIVSNNNQIYNNTFFANVSAAIFLGSSNNNNIHNNIAEGNGLSGTQQFAPNYDLFDANSNCGTNRWINNKFFTANLSCIN
jgi:hypothetical protein